MGCTSSSTCSVGFARNRCGGRNINITVHDPNVQQRSIEVEFPYEGVDDLADNQSEGDFKEVSYKDNRLKFGVSFNY